MGPRMPPPHSTSHPPKHTNINFRASLTKALQYSQTTSQIPRPTSQSSPTRISQIPQPLKYSLNQPQPLTTSLNKLSSFSLNLSNSQSSPPNRQTPTQTIPLHKQTPQARFKFIFHFLSLSPSLVSPSLYLSPSAVSVCGPETRQTRF